MTNRNYSFLDNLVMDFDRMLHSLPDVSDRVAGRANPAESVEIDAIPVEQRQHVAGLMRVNHAGEVSAQALYQGQGLTARDSRVKDSMQQAAAEEVDHLVWCEQRLQELQSHTSYLDPFWYMGSFSIGAFAGFLGDKWSLGFVVETERQVIRHLDSHLKQVPQEDMKTRLILEQMREDEAHHATMAQEAGAVELPGPVKTIMRFCSRVMTRTAYRI